MIQKYQFGLKELAGIFNYLSAENYQNIGPKARDGAIMIEALSSFNDMAQGYHEEIEKGHYRINDKQDGSLFQYTVGPQSFKKYLNPARRKLWGAKKNGNGFKVIPEETTPPKMALWGIRSCDISSIDILDHVFMGDYENDWYRAARNNLLVIAVGCTTCSSNCFCTSMGTGPMPENNYDLLITEVTGENHYFICETGSENGEKIANVLRFPKAKKEDVSEALNRVKQVEEKMSKRFNPEEAAVILKDNIESPHWDEVAKRCLSCANCTLVCPTCFCSSTEDVTDVTGDHTERWLRWDSCFNGDFSYLHGGNIRNTTKSRYRQWMTHKLSSWYDQFGSSGCVGCGRCITWCPVGIDLTEELLSIKSTK